MMLPEDADIYTYNETGSTSDSDITHYSTLNIRNVNYTNNGIGLQCTALNSTSAILTLTGNLCSYTHRLQKRWSYGVLAPPKFKGLKEVFNFL